MRWNDEQLIANALWFEGGLWVVLVAILILPLDSSREPDERYIVVEVHYHYENCCTFTNKLYLVLFENYTLPATSLKCLVIGAHSHNELANFGLRPYIDVYLFIFSSHIC